MDVIVQLIPLAIGVILSPLAIMALVAELLSRRNRINGVAYAVGWTLSIIVTLALASWLFVALDVRGVHAMPVWVSVVRLVLGVFLVVAAVWIYRRGAAHTRQMAAASSPQDVVAAAPQLPGWLKAVENFTPVRSFFLGFGIFLFNPVDASCAILAALTVVASSLSFSASVGILACFAVIGVLPILLPVLLVLVRGSGADPFLHQVRAWIGSHTSALNAAFVLVIGVLQLQKALNAFIG